MNYYRSFVFESTFLKRTELDKDIIEKIGSDEVELMKFGLGWLIDVFFGSFSQGGI